MIRNTKPTDIEIQQLQSIYDEGNSLRFLQKQFGWCRRTLIKYLKTRTPKHISKEERKQRKVNSVISWRKRAKEKLVEYKGGKCKICGYNRCMTSMVFHHRNPDEKEFGITGRSVAFDTLKKEVDKCELLCSNCHGEVHSGLISI